MLLKKQPLVIKLYVNDTIKKVAVSFINFNLMVPQKILRVEIMDKTISWRFMTKF